MSNLVQAAQEYDALKAVVDGPSDTQKPYLPVYKGLLLRSAQALAAAVGVKGDVPAPAPTAKPKGRPKSAPKAAAPAAAPAPAAAAPAPAATVSEKPSLKKVVTELLSKSKEGMQLKEIATEVDKLIKEGKYASSAKNVTAIVSQALNQLKAEAQIVRNDTSKKYQLVNAA